MLSFNVESPLLQHDMEQDNIAEKQGIISYFSKMLKLGSALLLIGIVVISIYGFPMGIKSNPDRIWFFLFIIWEIVTLFLIFVPLMFKGRILALVDSQYLQAGVEKIHNCNAYLTMPGMEKYKNYAEKVRNQGRELTNFECDEITKYYTSQVYTK